MSALIQLTAYDRFVWGRLAETARAWREFPNRDRALEVERAGRLAVAAALPFADDDQRRGQLYGIAQVARDFSSLSLADKNGHWPAIACGLAAIDYVLRQLPEPKPAPPPPLPIERKADETLDPGNLPYWVE